MTPTLADADSSDDEAFERMEAERDDCTEEMLEEAAEEHQADSSSFEAAIDELSDEALNDIFDSGGRRRTR